MVERPRRVFLIGLMGAGKSTVGRRLATRIGWPYVDNDELVRRTSGRAAPEIAVEDGTDALHQIELEAFDLGAALPPPVIVGVAGYVVMNDPARARMRSAGYVVWLRARPETLHIRVGTGRGRRPAATSLEWVRSVVAERSPTFLDAADLVVDVDRMRPKAVAEEIVQRLALEA